MTKREAINIIYDNLQKGNYYYEALTSNMIDVPFIKSIVLCCDDYFELIRWHHYGSSASKNTKKDLEWVIQTIFGITPQEFINTYLLQEDLKK